LQSQETETNGGGFKEAVIAGRKAYEARLGQQCKHAGIESSDIVLNI
jgi:hypothetical protein